jgi:hypothetical protein
MSFFVMWSPNSLEGLAAAWLEVPNRASVSAAQAEIDRLLANDPYGHGRPLSEGLHALSVPPLCAVFEINEPAKLVYVDSVGVLREEPSNGQDDEA